MKRSMLTRRQFLHWSSLALGTALLSACASKAALQPSSAPTHASEGVTPTAESMTEPTVLPATPAPALSGEITMINGSLDAATDQMWMTTLPEMFMKQFPGTKVTVSVMPTEEQHKKVALLMAAGNPPDFIFPGADFMRYVKEGLIQPLDEFIAADPVLSDPKQIRQSFIDAGKLDGVHFYEVPIAGATGGMQIFVNPEHFDKAGVSYPDDSWTWDDYAAAAEKLTVREGSDTTVWGTAWGYLSGWDGGWAPIVWSNGGEVCDNFLNPTKLYFDSPEVINAWQWMQDLVYKAKSAPNPAVEQVLQQAGGVFASGKVAMIIDGYWMMQTYQQAAPRLRMNLIPKGGKGRVDVFWPGGQAIPKATKNLPLAWAWLRWLAVDEEVNKLTAKTSFSCGAPLVRAYDEYYSASFKDSPGGMSCIQCLEDARVGTINHPKWAEIFDTIIQPEWDKFANGSIDARQFSAAINDKANQKLNEQ